MPVCALQVFWGHFICWSGAPSRGLMGSTTSWHESIHPSSVPAASTLGSQGSVGADPSCRGGGEVVGPPWKGDRPITGPTHTKATPARGEDASMELRFKPPTSAPQHRSPLPDMNHQCKISDPRVNKRERWVQINISCCLLSDCKETFKYQRAQLD